jgi:hypothetical protein
MGGPAGRVIGGMGMTPGMSGMSRARPKGADVTGELEEALRALKEARDEGGRRRAVEALERAVRQLKERPKGGDAPAMK